MPRDEDYGGMDREQARRLERLERNERIGRKSRLLARLDPNREARLEGAFTNRVADDVGDTDLAERQQMVDEAAKAYEDALDSALSEFLGKPVDSGNFARGNQQAMIQEGEQEAAMGAFLLAHNSHIWDLEVQVGSWTVYCRRLLCEDVRVFEVDNEARERAIGLPPWPEDDKKRPA